MDHPDPTETLQRTIALATANVADGGGPFGAVVRLPGGELVEGVNRVTATNDPTAHAEVAAIREACARSGSPELRGAVLYSSCEPCPMCLSAALWARLDLVVFAAGRGDAARAGFDDSASTTTSPGRAATPCSPSSSTGTRTRSPRSTRGSPTRGAPPTDPRAPRGRSGQR